MRKQVKRGYSPSKAKVWECNLLPGAGVLRNTRSEAIAWFKQQLGVKRLPAEGVVTELVK